jgi:hypothetical protein
MKTNLAAKCHAGPERLTGVRHAHIGLKANKVINTALNEVNTAERMLYDCDASTLDKPLRSADTLILCPELGNETHVN